MSSGWPFRYMRKSGAALALPALTTPTSTIRPWLRFADSAVSVDSGSVHLSRWVAGWASADPFASEGHPPQSSNAIAMPIFVTALSQTRS